MKRKIMMLSILFASLFFFFVAPVSAETDISVITQDVSYAFGEDVEFSITLSDAEELQNAWLFVQPQGLGIANFLVEFEESGESIFHLTPAQLMLQPFSKVVYWYQLDFRDGSSVVTDAQEFSYTDNRFDWQHIGNGHFTLFWQQGNQDFGLAALNIAQQSWESLVPNYQAAPSEVIQVYIYPTGEDLQEAMQLGQMPWVAGHADPQLNVILVSIAPGPEQRLEMQRQIPHELAHLFTYASLQDKYLKQPVWLLEGLASLAELSENSDYTQALADANLTSAFLSMESLCDAFPSDEKDIYLAYAQSLSFTAYLRSEYGQTKLDALMDAYGEGLNYAAGFNQVYGISLAQAQIAWEKDTFGMNAASLVWEALNPYLFLLAILGVLPLIVLMVYRHFGKKHE